MRKYIKIYKEELLQQVIPFWMKHSRDNEHGGYFTCLTRTGEVFDKDKFMWLQGRQVWMLSMLYDNVQQDPAWLEFAEHGASFLLKHGRDQDGNWYFSLDRSGRPLMQPYNIFSDCFASMGLAGLYKTTKNDEYAEVARKTFMNILSRRDNPKGKYNKAYPGVYIGFEFLRRQPHPVSYTYSWR